jgi:hypothetical protein
MKDSFERLDQVHPQAKLTALVPYLDECLDSEVVLNLY